MSHTVFEEIMELKQSFEKGGIYLFEYLYIMYLTY